MLASVLLALAVGQGPSPTSGSAVVVTEWGSRLVCGPGGLEFDDVERTAVATGRGAPRGRPVGVVVDRGARVWIATPSEFGVVDVRGVFARTLRRADATDPEGIGEFVALERLSDGELELVGERGSWHYRPDARALPRLELVRAEGREFAPEADVSVGADGTLELEFERGAESEVAFAWRKRDEYAWHELDLDAANTGAIRGLAAGRHELVLAAVDADLRRTTRALVVNVARPRWTALGTFGIAALPIVLLAAALCARRMPTRRRERVLVGVLTALVCGQVLAALSTRTRAWPFVGFSMFRDVVAAESVVARPKLYATTSRGESVRIEWNGPAAERRALVHDLTAAADGDESAAARVLDALRTASGDAELVGFLLRAERLRLGRNGPRELASLELVQWSTSDAAR